MLHNTSSGDTVKYCIKAFSVAENWSKEFLNANATARAICRIPLCLEIDFGLSLIDRRKKKYYK